MVARERTAINLPDKAGSTVSTAQHTIPRNPGMPLDFGWVNEVRINRSAVERRAATLVTRRTVKKEWQAAWLLGGITFIYLTPLSGDDKPGSARRVSPVCGQPRRQDNVEMPGAPGPRCTGTGGSGY